MRSALFSALARTPVRSVMSVLNEASRSVSEIETYINNMIMLFRIRGQRKIPISVLISEFEKSGFSANPAQIKTMFAIDNPLISSSDDEYLYLEEIPTGAETADDEIPGEMMDAPPSPEEQRVERMARNAARRSIR